MAALTTFNHSVTSIGEAFKTAAKDTVYYANQLRNNNDATQDLIKLGCHLIKGTSLIIGQTVNPVLFNFLKTVENFFDTTSIIPALNELANCNEPAGTIGNWRDRIFTIGGVGGLICFLNDVNVINLSSLASKIGGLKAFGILGAIIEKTPFTFIADVIRNTPLYEIIGKVTLGFFVVGFVLNTLDLGKHIFAFAKNQDSFSGVIKSIIKAPFKHENKQRVISFFASLLKTAYFGLILIGVTNPLMIVLGGVAVSLSIASMLYGAYVKRHHDTTVDDAPVKPSHPIDEQEEALLDADESDSEISNHLRPRSFNTLNFASPDTN